MTVNQKRDAVKDIEEYYEYVGKLFSIAWGENWHFGYWPDDDTKLSFSEAQEELTSFIIQKFPVSQGQHVLDVGCGVGWPAIRLAREKDCWVTGITISDYQIEQAARIAQRERVSDRVSFEYGNGMELGFKDESFDALWALESLCHMPDTRKALSEMHRVLKPGGYMALTDVFAIIPLRKEHWEAMRNVMMIKSVHPFETYKSILQEVGFKVIELHNISKHTARTAMCLGQSIAKRATEIEKVYGADVDEIMKKDWIKMLGAFKRCGYLYGILQRNSFY